MTSRYSVADYTAALQAMLPRGAAWPRDPDAVQTAVVGALANTPNRVDASAVALLVDAFPATAVGLLPEWVAALGVLLVGSTAAQQAAVVSALTGSGGQSIAYFVALAAAAGVAITITQYRPWRPADPISLPQRGDAWAHSWHVTYAGAPVPALEAVITQFAPAHTVVAFN